ncbi:TPA: hypothetical protein ACWQLD_005152 [Escherichia coli]|uniref:hypothetical protein n=1 Tax=Escherichia coli TaxID=562 RepID=UPI002022D99A|nr:hypothetical protein [Escherichia coli]MDS0880682.1 hypothetical protein [Escherichia coli]
MFGWMLAYLAIGVFIGVAVMSRCINDYIKNGVIERRGRIYRIVEVTHIVKEIKDDRIK